MPDIGLDYGDIADARLMVGRGSIILAPISLYRRHLNNVACSPLVFTWTLNERISQLLFWLHLSFLYGSSYTYHFYVVISSIKTHIQTWPWQRLILHTGLPVATPRMKSMRPAVAERLDSPGLFDQFRYFNVVRCCCIAWFISALHSVPSFTHTIA